MTSSSPSSCARIFWATGTWCEVCCSWKYVEPPNSVTKQNHQFSKRNSFRQLSLNEDCRWIKGKPMKISYHVSLNGKKCKYFWIFTNLLDVDIPVFRQWVTLEPRQLATFCTTFFLVYFAHFVHLVTCAICLVAVHLFLFNCFWTHEVKDSEPPFLFRSFAQK